MPVEPERVRKLNAAAEQPGGKYVVYWAPANRRVDGNHGLLYAAEMANRCNLPVLYYEPLTFEHKYANDRLHTFMLEGAPENAKRARKAGLGYLCFLRRKPADPEDAIFDLAKDAAAIVTDDYPVYVVDDHNRDMPNRLNVACYAVDSSCVVPMARLAKREYAAYTIRPKIHRMLDEYLKPFDVLHVKRRFEGPAPSHHTEVTDTNIAEIIASSAIDHSVKPSTAFKGGRLAVEKRLQDFLEHNLSRYAEDRNHPSKHATSGMSPYLHFGQMSSLEIALKVKEYAKEHKIGAESYLEELLVRRELSFNYARHVKDPAKLSNLPDWCQQTMAKHARDKRDPTYSHKQLEFAETHDELWNAAQKEMLIRGKVHGYYRMYWGKKFLEWLPDYQEAVDLLIDIHGRYAVDGRDPNTFTNVLWCFGLHDRAWGERPIFGKLRYLSSDGMRHKTNTKAYIDEINQLDKTGQDPSRIE